MYFLFSDCFQMIEVDIPPSLLEEQGRQLYGAQLLQMQVSSYWIAVSLRNPNLADIRPVVFITSSFWLYKHCTMSPRNQHFLPYIDLWLFLYDTGKYEP